MTSQPCLIYPTGHPLSGQCVAGSGTLFAFSAEGEAAADSVAARIASAPALPEKGTLPDAGSLCLLQRIGSESSPGGSAQPGMFRSLCHADAVPFPLPSLEQLLAERKVTSLDDPAQVCKPTQALTFDVASGRLRCADKLRDPCHHTLSALLTGGPSPAEAARFACRPSSATETITNPCPDGTWLVGAGSDDSVPDTFECTNPCPEGSRPEGDGSGSYICMPAA
jgi:hypothetical protein